MSHSGDIDNVADLVDEALAKMERGLGRRAVLEELGLRAWQRGAKRYPPRLPVGVSSYPPEAATPVYSPRVAIEQNVNDGNPPSRRRRGA